MFLHFYQFLKLIPQGQVSTYGDLASFFGLPNHSRQIGRLLNQNSQIDNYPCYRVVASDGKIGGYKLGEKEKIRRLKQDGIRVENDRLLDFSAIRFQPHFTNYFLALPLMADNIKLFRNLFEQMPVELTNGKIFAWQKFDSAHLTILFLANLNFVKLAEIVAKLRFRENNYFDNFLSLDKIHCQGVDFFTGSGEKRVAFIACQNGVDLLKDLYRKIIDLLEVTEKRTFQPHLTVARIKQPDRFASYEKDFCNIANAYNFFIPLNVLRLYCSVNEHRQVPLIDFNLF